MYDAVTVTAIPADASVVAGYVNGLWPTYYRLPALFPNAIHRGIDVNGSRPDTDILDMEWGDATPAQCPGWIINHTGPYRPVIYCSLSRVWEILAACPGLVYSLWIAHYTDIPHFCTPISCGLPSKAASLVVATQYADPPGSGGNYDLSLCIEGWPE